MEFPSGHPYHHHHHRGHREEEEEERGRRGEEPYYPPPGYNPYGAPRGWDPHPPPPPPPPPYGGGEGEYRPWDADQSAGYGPGPVYPAVQHVAHEVGSGQYTGEGVEEGEGGRGHHWWRRHHGHGHGDGHQGDPFSVQHVSHETFGANAVAPAARPRTVKVFTKAREDYSLSIRDGKVILARSDFGDEYQHWIKDEKFSTKVKDEEGHPCFALVNKVTGEAIKHSIGAGHHVRLIPYNADYLDESILWTESRDTGEGFRSIRMVNNIRLTFDAFHGDDDHGGVHDGTTVVLWEWWKGKNQRWKIVPHCKKGECEVAVGESIASLCHEDRHPIR